MEVGHKERYGGVTASRDYHKYLQRGILGIDMNRMR